MPTSSLLAAVTKVIDTLTEASLLLVDAARWADHDRTGFSPLSLFGGPMKYWKFYRAKQRVAAAGEQIQQLRSRVPEASALPDAEVDLSTLNTINDLFEVLPFNPQRVGTPGGPLSFWHRFAIETTVLNQIETARLGVDNLLSEVGLLHARLRASAASPA